MKLPQALNDAPIDPETVGRYYRKRRGSAFGTELDHYTAARVTEDYDCETHSAVIRALGPGHTMVPQPGLDAVEMPASWLVVRDDTPEVAWPVTENELINEWRLLPEDE